MLTSFFYTLRAARLPVSIREYLTLLEALKAGVLDDDGGPTLDKFFVLARSCLVKDEALFDKFEQAFASYFRGAQLQHEALIKSLPQDWLRQQMERELTPEQKAQLQALGWDELMEQLRQRLAEQQERHEGGSRWIGTGGTSPFGHGGYNPAGVRIGGPGRQNSAVKVWEQRHYRDYADDVVLNTRQIKVALRRLRRFAREGSELELDLDHTIQATASNAGLLDLKLRPERHNKVKLILLMDVGGTMDPHVQRIQELFSAVRSEFKHLEFFYFHNCVYDHVWKNNQRRQRERTSTWDLIHTYNRDYRLIFVGDATMSPYEILQPGGSVEYHNEEAGAQWLQRLTQAFPRHVWINPEPSGLWQYRQSIALMQQLMHQHMYPLTLQGLEQAMRQLSK
ncbi:VWA domain-containing protein [Roseateles sp. BYS180W]|uniref:VWA domain-containing protein n=1 Tax=Roseateles rivi TaxID=3299028 RepID=A0ABW7FS24_9BURK